MVQKGVKRSYYKNAREKTVFLKVVFWFSFPALFLTDGLLDQEVVFVGVLEAGSGGVQLLERVVAPPVLGDQAVVVNGVFGTRRLQLQKDPLLFAASELSLVDVVPAVGLVVLGQTAALVLAQGLQRPSLDDHPLQ